MIKLLGVAEFRDAIEANIAEKIAATRAATARAAHTIERRAKQNLSRYSHERGTKTPSPPGDPPAVVSGTLRRGVKVEGPVPVGMDRFKAEIGPTDIYGRIQELGGELHNGGELPARPYMKPAVEDSIAEIRALFVQAWR